MVLTLRGDPPPVAGDGPCPLPRREGRGGASGGVEIADQESALRVVLDGQERLFPARGELGPGRVSVRERVPKDDGARPEILQFDRVARAPGRDLAIGGEREEPGRERELLLR